MLQFAGSIGFAATLHVQSEIKRNIFAEFRVRANKIKIHIFSAFRVKSTNTSMLAMFTFVIMYTFAGMARHVMLETLAC